MNLSLMNWSGRSLNIGYAPTSKNSQPYYFVVIRDRNKLEFLASLCGCSSAPIARARLAVANGCIAAYHFMLAAWLFGLETCWAAVMDREEVKCMLNIPSDHYIATVTPLGFLVTIPPIPLRRASSEMVRFID